MLTRLLCLYMCAIFAPLRAADVWVFLKDGRVCSADLSQSPLKGKLADGVQISFAKENIDKQSSAEAIDKEVDELLLAMSQGQDSAPLTQRFDALKQSATERLLHHLRSDARNSRLCALIALQYCWTANAAGLVTIAAGDDDPSIRKISSMLLSAHNSDPGQRERSKALVDSGDIKTALALFAAVEKPAPDTSLKRIKRLLDAPGSAAFLLPLLPHYLSPTMTPATLKFFDAGNEAQRRMAVVALIEQNARDPETRRRITELLASNSADMRELAAEYYTWLGAAGDTEALNAAREFEQDAHARAAIAGAIKASDARTQRYGKPSLSIPPPQPATAPQPTLSDYVRVRKSLAHSTPDALQAALAFYATSETVEAFAPLGQDEWKRVQQRCELAQELFAPGGAMGEHAEFFEQRAAPAAEHWTAPIRDYFDPNRKSFGIYVGKSAALFNDSYHAADDCGWTFEFRTVVAIAPGVVRLAACSPTWGHLVVIEHTPPDGGKLCSLYGHLSPMVLVRAGDVVAGGEKIGAIGRSETAENGGYLAHVHFGIHSGPFNVIRKIGEEVLVNPDRQHSVKAKVIQADEREAVVEVPENHLRYNISNTSWIAGYLSPGAWAEGGHGWLDPQTFLQERQ